MGVCLCLMATLQCIEYMKHGEKNLKRISHQTTEKQSQIESTPRLYNLVLDKLLLVKPSDFHTA